MPDYVVPGAPAVGTMCVIPPALQNLSRSLLTQADVAGEASRMPGRGAVEGALPGATLVNGVIAFEQSLERRLGGCYDELQGLASTVNGGLSTVSAQDEANAAAVCRVNDR